MDEQSEVIKGLENQFDRLNYAFKRTRKIIDPDDKMTAKQAYQHLQLSQSSFTAYKNGSEPSSLVLRRLAEPLGFSIHWLVTGQGSPFINESLLPGQISHITDSKKKISIDKELRSGLTSNIADLRYDTVLSSDMARTANEGSIILIDTEASCSEGLLLIEHDGQRLMRRVQAKSSDEVMLISETGSSQVLPKNDINILGRVIWRAGTP